MVIFADTSTSDARTVVNRINNHVKEWNHEGHLKAFDLTLSIGRCEWADGMTFDEVLGKADRAMYAEKNAAKNLATSSLNLTMLFPVTAPELHPPAGKN